MAIFEWRRFNFFELRNDADKGRIAETLKGVKISGASNGNGLAIICDEDGNIHVFSKGWECISFKGHDAPVLFCSISMQNNFLVTIGNEENGTGALFKIWNLSKISKSTYCLRSGKCAMPRPCALGVSENGQFMAIGYERGNISLYRGDITRDRSKTLKSLTAGTSAIVGIAFKHYDKSTQMFVCSNSGVYVFNLLKDREVRQILDTETSQMRCCELQKSHFNEGHFMVGRDDAIYCYTSDGRGPCYVLEGEKQFIKWFRNHLIIISTCQSTTPSGTVKSTITVIDLTNKFIVFSTQVNEILAVFIEFGTCFLVSSTGTIYHLSEKDLQSKLSLLYKKNLFDIAVRVAKAQHHDNEGLAEIFRQYGDHLYNKSNYNTAVEQYIKTIGYLEPSYVIRKFLDSRHIQYLSTYLQALHEKRQATADHTTLLVNCFTRLNKTVKLEEFFDLYNGKDITFDVEVAATVCRDTMAYDQALTLTEKSKRHNIHIDILLNDLHYPSEACSYIETLKPEDAKEALLKYGTVLIEKKPEETVKILKTVCKVSKSRPEEFMFIFVDSPECLLDFLEDITRNVSNCSQLVYDTLIELYLKDQNRKDTESKLMQILMERKLYDQGRAMFLCRQHSFWPGLIYLFGEERLSHLIVRYCVQNEDYEELLNCCQQLGNAQPSLWLQALMGIRSNPRVPIDLVQKVLNVITHEKLLSPLQVLNSLAVENGPNLGAVRDFFTRAFKKEMESRKRDEEIITKYKEESVSVKSQIENIRKEPIDFKDPACSACKQALTLPSLHFYCKHSFHLECIQSFQYSDADKECPVCADLNQQIMEVLRSQGSQAANHEQFHTLLERSPETFSIISEYLGRGLFNQILLVDDNLSQTEVDMAVPSKVIPKIKPLRESPQLQRQQEDNITNFITQKPQTLKVSPKPSPRISPVSMRKNTIAQAVSKNPFDEEDEVEMEIKGAGNPFEEYDDSKNPFADEE